MSTPSPLFPPTTGPFTVRGDIPLSYILSYDGTNYHADSMLGGVDLTPGIDPTPLVNQAITNSPNGARVFLKSFKGQKTTYTTTGTVYLAQDIILEAEAADLVALQANGNFNLIQTTPNGNAAAVFRPSIRHLDLEASASGGNVLYVAPGTQYGLFEDLILGGGISTTPGLVIADSATLGTYYNNFVHVHQRATSVFGTGLQIGVQAGSKSPGPNWFHGCTFNANNTEGIRIGCGPQFFFGTELFQGNAYSNSTVMLHVTPTIGNGFAPQVWFFGDFEGGSATTVVQVDANAQLHAEGHFGITIPQLSVAGQAYIRALRTGLSNSFVYDSLYAFSNDLLAQTTTGGSPNFVSWTPLNQQTFEVGGYISLNAISGGASPNIQLVLNWTDENNTGHTLPLVGIDTLGANDTNSLGTAGHYLTVKSVSIRIKANTVINLSGTVNGAPASINYDIGGWIRPGTGT